MRALLVGVMGGLAALIGFAGAASASATIDLFWSGSGTASTSATEGASSTTLTLSIVITAGANGVNAYSFGVDYDQTAMTVVGQANGPTDGHFGSAPSVLADDGDVVTSFSGAAVVFIPGLGTGLSAGNTHLAGTIQFHLSGAAAGNYTQLSGFYNIAVDGIADMNATDISGTSTFNSATLVLNAIPEPGTASLLVIGLGGLALVGRRRKS